jgi:hypothetical protein
MPRRGDRSAGNLVARHARADRSRWPGVTLACGGATRRADARHDGRTLLPRALRPGTLRPGIWLPRTLLTALLS